jgi:hypothetical protein
MPYSAVRALSRSTSGRALGGGGKVRAFAGSALERKKLSKPAGSVTSKKRAPSGADTVFRR